MPVIFHFRTFGDAEAEATEDVADLLLDDGDWMAASQLDRIGAAGKIDVFVIALDIIETFSQVVDLLLCGSLQFIEELSDFTFRNAEKLEPPIATALNAGLLVVATDWLIVALSETVNVLLVVPPAIVNPVAAAVSASPLYVLPVSAEAIFPSAIAVAFQVPVPIVPSVVTLALPAQVDRAVFSTEPRPTSDLVGVE